MAKEKKKVVSYRIRETTIEKVRKDAHNADMSINDYVDKLVTKCKVDQVKNDYVAKVKPKKS